MPADFKGLAAALLSRADDLVPQWLPGGKRAGHEWVCAGLAGDAGRSCSVNLETGKWAEFAGDARGSDLISLWAAQHGQRMGEAAVELASMIGYPLNVSSPPARANGHAPATAPAADPKPAPAPEPAATPEAEPGPAPLTAALPAPAGYTGRWAYYLAGDGGPVLVVCRMPPVDGKKSFLQYTFRGGRWVAKSLPEPRPLYRLRELLARPTAPVLLVEGEKTADAAQAALPDHVVITWAGGAKAHRKTDFSPLAGRSVIVWPDDDEAGHKAMAEIIERLLPLGATVATVPTDKRGDGFDAADASIAEIVSCVASAEPLKMATVTSISRHPRSKPMPPAGEVIDADDTSAHSVWQSIGLECNGQGQPYPSLGNANIILARHPALAGKIWLDTFRREIRHTFHDGEAPVPWTDSDSLRLTAWMNQALKLPKIGVDLVHRAVELAAFNARRNSVTSWLDSLNWDGTERLTHWLEDCLGVARTPYTMAVARNWLISMVARAYDPGCQADHMPVLEGSSGMGKSSALAILGGEWYCAAPQAFGSKEFFEAIQGVWLTEIPDMVGFGRREHTQIISAITTRSDKYRASYGRFAENHPRTTIFAATSETDDYLQDSRGIRRYWPLTCTDINLETLERNRGQLFAEAVLAYRAGATWHQVPREEAHAEQLRREQADPWQQRIAEFIRGRTSITNSDVADECLRIPADRQDRAMAMRIAKCLKAEGFLCKVEWLGNGPKRIYRKP